MLLFMVIIKVIPLVSVFLALGSQVCVTPPAFFHGFCESNSGPHVCVASTFLRQAFYLVPYSTIIKRKDRGGILNIAVCG